MRLQFEFNLEPSDEAFAKQEIYSIFTAKQNEYEHHSQSTIEELAPEFVDELMQIIALSKELNSHILRKRLFCLFKRAYCFVYGLKAINRSSILYETMSEHVCVVMMDIIERNDRRMEPSINFDTEFYN